MTPANEMELKFDSRSANEGFARVAVAAFMTQLNPTVEEVADVKTAVSEAVTNVIIHGYEKEVRKVYIKCMIEENIFTVEVCDQGKGIENIEEAMCPMYTTRPDQDRSGMGFAFMEAFMDSVEVESELGKGTRVRMDDTIALIRKSHSGDKAAREQLVKENVGLVHCVVKRFLERGAEREDLFQIGSIGLLKAIDKFDLTYNVKFSTYAVPLISGEIKRFLRDDGMVKVSRSIKENAVKSMRAAGQLRDTLGCEPTVEQIAAACELSVEDITLSMSASMEVESIYKTIYQGDGSEVMLMDKLEDKADIGETASSKVALAQLMETLSQREKELIRMRYYDDYTQMQVAKEFGISQVQVSRMEKKILSGMRKRLFA